MESNLVSKPPLDYTQQLNLLKSRGLEVSDEPFAIHCLAHINYYRVSAYRFPFTQKGNPDQFKKGILFSHIWELYCFDRKLRQLIIESCKQIEISVRSRWAYLMGCEIGPQSYEHPRNFKHFPLHQKTLENLDIEIKRSKEDFILHYKKKYGTSRPEIWVIVEVASFGTISNFLKHTKQAGIRQRVADSYGLDEKVLCSLIHHLSVLRNAAAHHSRIWNRKFTVLFNLPRKKPNSLFANFSETPDGLNKQDRKIYNTLVMLIHMMKMIEPGNDWDKRLYEHLTTLPEHFFPSMGFPLDWEERPIWKQFK